ncbi:hypothetical protein DM52_1002 [Burkholderia mallei]|nr:hypothetical protein DM52_1002 [Burkholderia mallei]
MIHRNVRQSRTRFVPCLEVRHRLHCGRIFCFCGINTYA